MSKHLQQQLHTFHGGIHPPENKTQSTQTAIEAALLPNKLILPLQQHIGQQAQPLVSVGDRVLKGQMIAASAGYVSAAIHAPSSGIITAIEAHPLPHPSGLSEQCIIIEPDGQEEWIELTPLINYQQADKETLLQQISNAGITGLGGASFPTAVKLNPSEELHIDTLILNAAECEPYITADDMLMRERATEVIQGLEIIAQILQPSQCLIGIENNKPEAYEALQQAVDSSPLKDQIKILRIPTKYPSGGEKQLIQILTGKEVPNGGLPADIGIVCHNVGTAVAIYRAIHKGEPLVSRITTVTGEAVKRKGNIEVLLGTPIEALLTHFEVQEDKLHCVIMGGPMMGFTLDSVQLPIVKASNCILATTQKELPDPAREQACIRCGMCAEVCPATLLPQQLYWFSKSREFDKALSHNLLDCIECGACSYVCPSNIPLVQYYRFAKGEIRIEEQERTASDQARQRFEARQARLDQEEADKEAKRQARADAAEQSKKAKAAAAEDGEAKPVDSKAAVVQAALERAQARKAKKAESQAIDNDTSNTTGEASITSSDEQPIGDQTATQDNKESKGLSALEKAKAKRTENTRAPKADVNAELGADKPKTKGLSALERAKAKRAGNNGDQAAKSSADTHSNLEAESAKPLSALEKAKAKRAQTASQSSSETATSAEDKPLSALQRAKAKRAETTQSDSAESNKPATGTASEKSAAPMSALERAKAKRAEKTTQQAADDSAVDTHNTD